MELVLSPRLFCRWALDCVAEGSESRTDLGGLSQQERRKLISRSPGHLKSAKLKAGLVSSWTFSPWDLEDFCFWPWRELKILEEEVSTLTEPRHSLTISNINQLSFFPELCWAKVWEAAWHYVSVWNSTIAALQWKIKTSDKVRLVNIHGQFELEKDQTSVLGNVAKSEMWKLIIDKCEFVCRTCV